MSDWITRLQAQLENHPPGFPLRPPTRNWVFSQPSSSSSPPPSSSYFFSQPSSSSSHPPSSSSSYISAQLNTTLTLFSANGTTTSFNYGQPRHFHMIEQTHPYQVSSAIPHSISPLTPRSVPPPRVNTQQQFILTPQPISCVPPWATDRPAAATPPQPFSPPTHYPFSSAVPHTTSQETDRSTVRRLSTLKHVIRAQPISYVPPPATDRRPATTPQPMSPRVSCSVPQVAAHSLPQAPPQETHEETHAQHAAAATSESGPDQVTIRRSDPNRVMTPEEVYAFVFCSPEWRIEERVRENGKFKGRTEYFYKNLMIPKQFRSLKSVGEYLQRNEIPKSVSKRKMQDQKANTMTPQKRQKDEQSRTDLGKRHKSESGN